MYFIILFLFLFYLMIIKIIFEKNDLRKIDPNVLKFYM